MLSTEARAWKRIAAATAQLAGCKPMAGDVAVEIILHPRLTKKGKANRVRVDLDGSIKCALDALNGVAYDDDKQVIRLSAEVGQPMIEGGLTVIVGAA